MLHNNINYNSNGDMLNAPRRLLYIQHFGVDFTRIDNIHAEGLTYKEIKEIFVKHLGSNFYETVSRDFAILGEDEEYLLENDLKYSRLVDGVVNDPVKLEESFLEPALIEIEHAGYMLLFSGLQTAIFLACSPMNTSASISFMYRSEDVKKQIETIVRDIGQLQKSKADAAPDDTEAEFQLITKDKDGFSTIRFDFDYQKYNNFDLSKNYNDSLIPVSDKIVKHLNRKKSSGITILHGPPGTGKTTYLRYLVSVLKKDIIYLPPDMTNVLSDPSIIDFMKTQSGSVFIIEDGEQILRKRSESGNITAVSNMLNVSDGLLADVLHFNFVITMNCSFEDIDEALRRPGRLVAEYEFKALSADKSVALLETLYPNISPDKFIKKPMTLAEIYSYDEELFVSNTKKNGIGFTAELYG